MKLSEIMEIYKFIEEIANNGKQVADFGIDDQNGEVYASLNDNSGELYTFVIDKERKAK